MPCYSWVANELSIKQVQKYRKNMSLVKMHLLSDAAEVKKKMTRSTNISGLFTPLYNKRQDPPR